MVKVVGFYLDKSEFPQFIYSTKRGSKNIWNWSIEDFMVNSYGEYDPGYPDSIRIRFLVTHNIPGEARADTFSRVIKLNPNKFFGYNSAARKAILYHEVGHFVEHTLFHDWGYFDEILHSGIFGVPRETKWGFFDGIYGHSQLTEAVADTFSIYHTEPGELKKRYPRAYKFIKDLGY